MRDLPRKIQSAISSPCRRSRRERVRSKRARNGLVLLRTECIPHRFVQPHRSNSQTSQMAPHYSVDAISNPGATSPMYNAGPTPMLARNVLPRFEANPRVTCAGGVPRYCHSMKGDVPHEMEHRNTACGSNRSQSFYERISLEMRECQLIKLT